MHRALLAALLVCATASSAHAQQPPPQAPPHPQTGPAPQGPQTPGQQAAVQQVAAGGAVAAGAPGTGGVAAPVAGAQDQAAPPQGGPGPQAPGQQTEGPPVPPPHVALPVVVVMWPDRSVAQPVADAIRTAVVEAIAPGARGRPTVALADPARLPPVLACNADAACVGAKLAELQGVAGVLVHATRRNRTAAIDVRVELVDPVSGAPRHEPAVGQVPYAQEASPAAAVTALVAPLLAALPAPPPPPPTLLVVVNVDGAQIMVDGHDLGRSPALPQEVPAGRHNVVVSRSGWATGNRMVNVADTGATRTDVDLEPSTDTLAGLEAGRIHDSGGGNYASGAAASTEDPAFYKQWWFWAAVGGGVVLLTVIAVAVAASGTDIGPPNGVGIPGIH